MSKLTYIAKEDLLTALGKEQFTEEESKHLEGDLGQEYAFLMQFNNAVEGDKKKFLDEFDPALLKEISLSLSARVYVQDMPHVEGEEEIFEMYSRATDGFMHSIGEAFSDRKDSALINELSEENRDLTYNNRVLNTATVDLEKLRALDSICHDYPLAMQEIHTVAVPMDSAGYFRYMADRDECKRRMNEAGLHPDFCAGNLSTSRQTNYPLYQKNDYYQDAFLTQTEVGLKTLKDMGIDIHQNGAIADGLVGKVYESRSQLATQRINNVLSSYDTVDDALAEFIIHKNEAVLLDINSIAKNSEVALNTLFQCRVRGDNDVALSQAFHGQRDKMFQNFTIAEELYDNRIEAIAKLSNMADISKTAMVFDGKPQVVPQASNRQYMRNLNALTRALKANMLKPEEVDNFDKYSSALQEVSNLAVRKYNSLSLMHRIFHPIISSEMKKTAVEMNKYVSGDLLRESDRMYVMQRQNALNSGNLEKHKLASQLDADFEKDFYALGYKSLAKADVRKFNVLRMALLGKIPDETIFALPTAVLTENQSATIQATIAEMKQEAKNGNKAYFDAMMDKTGEFIKNMKLPDFKTGSMTDIAAVTIEVNEMSRFALDFTQVQPLGQYAEYAKAHPEVDKAEMLIEQMGKFTNDLILPVGKVKALAKGADEPLTIENNQALAVINAAEAVNFLAQNKDSLSGKKLTEVKLNPLALQRCGVELQVDAMKKSKEPAIVNEAIKLLQGEPNRYKPTMPDNYTGIVTTIEQRAQALAKPQAKQKLVDREPAFKENFTQTKTQERKTEAPTQSQTINKSGPTVSDK